LLFLYAVGGYFNYVYILRWKRGGWGGQVRDVGGIGT
jgi:hypothetical protein